MRQRIQSRVSLKPSSKRASATIMRSMKSMFINVDVLCFGLACP